jgi:hypothetical protein
MRIGAGRILFNGLGHNRAYILKNACYHRVLIWIEVDDTGRIWQSLSIIDLGETSLLFIEIRVSICRSSMTL